MTNFSNENAKMNPEVKEKWLSALRSGNFKQGQGALRRVIASAFDVDVITYTDDENSYCCLGVLNEVYLETTGNGHWERKVHDDIYDFVLVNDRDSGMPNQRIYNWAGLVDTHVILDEEDADTFNFGDPHFFFASANDRGVSFETIAYVIEKYL